jgi:hypothetical protein
MSFGKSKRLAISLLQRTLFDSAFRLKFLFNIPPLLEGGGKGISDFLSDQSFFKLFSDT